MITVLRMYYVYNLITFWAEKKNKVEISLKWQQSLHLNRYFIMMITDRTSNSIF